MLALPPAPPPPPRPPEQQQLVKHLVNGAAGLVDGAAHGAPVACQRPQRFHHILGLESVQACRQGAGGGVYGGLLGCGRSSCTTNPALATTIRLPCEAALPNSRT